MRPCRSVSVPSVINPGVINPGVMYHQEQPKQMREAAGTNSGTHQLSLSPYSVP